MTAAATRVGVIGTGTIGGAIAANLVADGRHVGVFDAKAGNVFTDRMVEGIDERGRPPMSTLAPAAKD